MESLAGLIESLSEETRARLGAFEVESRRISDAVDKLTESSRETQTKLGEVAASLKAIQELMDAELARISDGVGSHREEVLGAMLETRDRIHEAELSLLDVYTRTHVRKEI